MEVSLPDHVLQNKERQKFDSVRNKIRIMTAYIDGKEIIEKHRETATTRKCTEAPVWDWDNNTYMIAVPNYDPGYQEQYISEPQEDGIQNFVETPEEENMFQRIKNAINIA